MKKIIAVLAISLAFGLHANAQEKVAVKEKATVKETSAVEKKSVAPRAKMDDSQMAAMNEAVEKDVKILSDAVSLDAESQKKMEAVFRSKHKALSRENLTDERKAVISQTIEAKIKASLSPKQNEKLAAQPEVMKQLIH